MIPVEEFWAQLDGALADGSCLGTTLSKRRSAAVEVPEKWTVRPTTVKGARVFQWAARSSNRETHENLPADRTAERIRQLLGTSYEHAHVFTAHADFDVRVGQDGCWAVRRSGATQFAGTLDHNRPKTRLIPENVPCRFLAEIGVMTPAGKVRASKMGKFRQINRFLELVDDVWDHLPAHGPLRVVDFGCGKSYLTFAIHHLLTGIHHREASILGFERRADVVDQCARLSSRLGCQGLEFRAGEISALHLEGPIDLAVSLHACDTATDDALAQAVAGQAAVIMAVPCCQHELAPLLRTAELAPLHRHGILHEQFASLATDSLRAQALEACGYKTQVVEFVDLEHTSKNLLLRAVRRPAHQRNDAEARAGYEEFKQTLGLTRIASDRIIAAS